jgi:dolichol-phosphate mannosyltransferase
MTSALHPAIPHPVCDVSLVIPTYNESANLPILAERLAAALDGRDWELVVVDDDSPDRTWEVAENLSPRFPVRAIRRIGRRGLSSAVVEGLHGAYGKKLVVMDADLQHDPTRVPALIDSLDNHQVAVGSRYVDQGSTGEWGGRRLAYSKFATLLCRLFLGIGVSDPMSGFFALRKDYFLSIAEALRPRGYKILMEILFRGKPERVEEVPIVFGKRLAGESKLGSIVAVDYVISLMEMRVGIELRQFIRYAVVGLTGVVVNLAALHGLLYIDQSLGADYSLRASIIATVLAMVSNYFLNNFWTFRDFRLTGRNQLGGMIRFAGVSGTGALINISVTWFLQSVTNGVLPLTVATLIGIAISTVWNFELNSRITWKTV